MPDKCCLETMLKGEYDGELNFGARFGSINK